MLLLKLKKGNYIFRKNAFNLLFADLFIIVDEDNNFKGYSFWDDNNHIYIIRKNTMKPEKIIRLIGEDKINSLRDKDAFIFWDMNNYFALDTPVHLTSKVNSVRRVKKREVNKIKKCIVSDLILRYNISFEDKLYNTSNYKFIYSLCIEYDLDDMLFKLMKK